MIKQSKYERYLKSKLEPKYQIVDIKLLKILPKGVKYFYITFVDGERDKSFEIQCIDCKSNEITIYVQVTSILWYIFKSIYFIKVEDKYERIYL